MQILVTTILVLLSFSNSCFCQLDEDKLLGSKLKNTSWSCEDSTQVEEYEMLVMSFSEDSISQAYINWLDGFYSNRCSYKTTIIGSYFELKLGGCRNLPTDIKYAYCYFTEGNIDEINVLFSETKIASINLLDKQKKWIKLKRFEE